MHLLPYTHWGCFLNRSPFSKRWGGGWRRCLQRNGVDTEYVFFDSLSSCSAPFVWRLWLHIHFTHCLFTLTHSSNTGGDIANLRQLHVDQIQRYHRDFYRPENISIIIGGKIERDDDILQSLASIETTILAKLAKRATKPYHRPWLDLSLTDFPQTSQEVSIWWSFTGRLWNFRARRSHAPIITCQYQLALFQLVTILRSWVYACCWSRVCLFPPF